MQEEGEDAGWAWKNGRGFSHAWRDDILSRARKRQASFAFSYAHCAGPLVRKETGEPVFELATPRVLEPRGSELE